MQTDVESLPIALPEGVDYDEYVIGTYLVSYLTSGQVAPALAIEQYTNTWVPVPAGLALPPEVRCRLPGAQIRHPCHPQTPWQAKTAIAQQHDQALHRLPTRSGRRTVPPGSPRGCDIVKDDELLASAYFYECEKRVELYRVS